MSLLIGNGGRDVRVGQVRLAHLSHRIDENAAKTGKGAVKVEVLRVVGTRITCKIVKNGLITSIDARGFRPMASAKQEELILGELEEKFNSNRI
jgi:hypothetical protein